MRFPNRKHKSLSIQLLILLVGLVTFNVIPAISHSQIDDKIPYKKNTLITTPNGSASIKWPDSLGGDVLYELQQSSYADFSSSKRVYRGLDLGAFISGLSEGRYHYRVRFLNKDQSFYSPWFSFVTVNVKYQSMTLAWILFSVGAFIFLAIVFVVLKESNKKENP